MTELYLGIDIGTTGTKSVVADSCGRPLKKGHYEYSLSTPFAGAFEQNPNKWYKGTVESVRQALKGLNRIEVKAVSLSAQGGSFFVAENKDGEFFPITDAYTWMDIRAEDVFNKISEEISPEEFYKITGWRLSSSSMFCKLLWLKKNAPEIFKRADMFFTTSDYIYYKLTGKTVIDYTGAALTGLFDVNTKKWSERLLGLVGISEKQLPTLMQAGREIGNLKTEAAEETGLTTEVTAICGVHDQYAVSIASGTASKNDIFISAGTTWVVFGISEELHFSKKFLSPCPHPFGGYGVIGSAVSSGTVMEWMRKQFGVSFEEIEEQASNRETDCGLMVYPFITGCGDYRDDKDVGAAIIGLSFKHDKFDVIRASMEGVAFEIKTLLCEFEKSGVKVERIKIAGGGAKSELWVKILASVLEKEIFVLSEKDACALGAAVLASKNLSADILSGKIVVPDVKLTKIYKEKYLRYSENVTRAKNIR